MERIKNKQKGPFRTIKTSFVLALAIYLLIPSVAFTAGEGSEYQVQVEKYLVEIEVSQRSFLDYQQKQTAKYAEFRKELEMIRAEVVSKKKIELKNLYEKSAQIWRDLVDHIFDLYRAINRQKLLTPPLLPLALDDSELSSAIKKSYLELNDKAVSRYQALEAVQILFLKQEKEIISDLLLLAGAVRSLAINRCRYEDCAGVFDLTDELVSDVVREIKVVPFKAVALGMSKSIEVRKKLSDGMSGWMDLGRQALLLCLLLATPFVMFSLFGKTALYLDRIQKSRMSRSMFSSMSYTQAEVWLSRLTPFFPWAAMWGTTVIAQGFLRQTDIREIAEPLSYLKIYFIYRVSRLALTEAIGSSFGYGNLAKLNLIQKKVTLTATRLARIGLLEFVLLKATSDAVREAFVYTILSYLIFWINLAVTFYESARWEEEIWSAVRGCLTDQKFSILVKVRHHWTTKLLNPFLFGYVVFHLIFSAVLTRLFHLDFFKWISSEVFRKKLERNVESASTGARKVPEDYLNYFSFREAADEKVFISPSQGFEQKICGTVQCWTKDLSQSNAIMLCGNRGMGKTSILARAKDGSQSVKITCFQLRKKYKSKENFFELLSEIFDSKIQSTQEFLLFDQALVKKQVLFIDDFQNIFLSALSGLNAYRCFLEVLSLPTKNTFWCVAINTRSWSYLKGVFGIDHFTGKILDFTPWTDIEIQELILKRHCLTGYDLKFDDRIQTLGSETQFFRLLWSQSRGNPRSALVYWVSALSWWGGKTLQVGVPPFLNSSKITALNDDSLFVLSAITRHENLSLSEIHTVTGISETVIRNCLKNSIGVEILWSDPLGRFRVTPKGQYLIDYYLLGKNFLYE